MTTIAARGRTMAADTAITGGAGDYIMRGPKLVQLRDGGVAGGAGEVAKSWAGLDWMAKGEKGDPPDIDGASILILRPNGSLWMANGQFPAFPVNDKCAAIGCGSLAAMVAMDAGDTAAEAVRRVAKFDPSTAEPVQTLSIKSRARK